MKISEGSGHLGTSPRLHRLGRGTGVRLRRVIRPTTKRRIAGATMHRTASRRRVVALLGMLSMLVCHATTAATPGGRIIATGGGTMVEGAAGGGIVPWAVLPGYAEQGQIGGTAWATRVAPSDFDLTAFGASIGWSNRIGLSVGRQRFDVDKVVPGKTLEQDVIGVKVRLSGDLIYTRLPQFSIGAMWKRNRTFVVPDAVGAEDDSGVDLYVAAGKLWLDGIFGRSVFLNGTLRATRANQLGLLGFGGDRKDSRSIVGEASAGIFLDRHWVIGAEYRQKPDNLSFADEDDWFDVFVGWFPGKRIAVVAAWSDLGSIAGLDDQQGAYLSVQFSQ